MGKSKDELVILCGKPIKINRDTYGSNQWVYRGTHDLYVYEKDGVVYSVQWSE